MNIIKGMVCILFNTYILKFASFLGILLLLAGCASTHNMKDGGEGFWGGGYLVEPVSEDVYKIIAKTNVAQWEAFGTARRMWERHAKEACNGRPYVESEVYEYTYEDIPPYLWNRYIVTVKEGVATCTTEE
jgi:hypothetical protein